MAEIGFYHLTRSPLGHALPRLLARTLESGERALVLCPDGATARALDQALWEVPPPAWLPHGTEADGDADLQPIWIATRDEVPNGARFLFLTHGAESSRLDAFARVFDLFDGADEAAVARARERWKAAKSAGHALTYWRQTERGWERAA
jgi:DNA polymerase-3 subunit chi